MFMGKEHAQTVWRPLIIIINTGDVMPLRLDDGLITHRAGARVDLIMGVTYARVV